MASSLTSSVHKSFKYDVFLSFRGEDTRTNFVDHLYHALQQKSIHIYKDDEKIKKGKKISDELIGSIEDSKFYIIVFSKNYASSSWCLDELVKIMECHRTTTEHTAYPVFYDVEPSEVRKQSGAVGEAFAKYEMEEAAETWKVALKEAADLSGWELKKTADGHEAKVIQRIVEEISLELRSISLNIDGKLVGMETRIKNLVPSLGIGCDNVHMIGIKGMGGGGKTTLARALFDRISLQFEGKSFAENVRENASLFGLKSLQKQILSDVLNEDIRVSSVYDGKDMMKRRLPHTKVLVVLDDVDHIDQLEALAGEPNWFKPGSRIIITTRDEQVLIAHGVKFIHDVNLLSDKEAICLFSRHAFGRDIPVQGYEELSRKVVRYAAGLPLTIRVLGSFLCGKDELEWIDAIERLKTIPETETLKKLELSYTCLEEDYKEIFLDVACIMKGWQKDKAIKALESCGFRARNGLKVLQQKSLITIYKNFDDHIGMHDHIVEMGRNIVRRRHPDKPQRHSRLWIEDEIEEILANDLGTEATRCIQFHTIRFNPHIFIKGLRKMKELRFLSIRGYCSSDLEFSTVVPDFPNALRCLDWTNYPFRSLRTTFQANNIAALKMDGSRIVQLWEGGERKALNKLRFLDLSSSLLSTLDIGLAPNLEELGLFECKYLEKLHLPERCLNLKRLLLTNSKLRTLEIGLTPNLEKLYLERSCCLEELHMVNECQKLAELRISHSNLRTFDLGMTPNLKKLDLKECRKLINYYAACSVDESLEVGPLAKLHLIVESIERCQLHPDSNLPKFQFRCFYTEDRPSLTRNLEMLFSVGMCACTNLETFSRSIYGLQRLRELELKGIFLEAIMDIDQLESLEELILLSTKIKHLPDSICMLKHLKYLKLYDCSLLEKLPEDLGQLECLKKLRLTDVKMIKHLPDSICMLKRLKYLNLYNCSLLERLPEDLGQLECLEKLHLTDAKIIKHLPDSICMLKRLKDLRLCGLLLEKLPEDIGQLECLEELNLMGCERLQDIPNSICEMKRLKYFFLDDCIRVKKLPEELERLECLEVLYIDGTIISHLPLSILLLNEALVGPGKDNSNRTIVKAKVND
ncbi:unnamed protein product [Lactuca virosa]|uniref:TIR domain-containing protein n=1 Tax=Lactuca virosa TaxID=75947 RepID=A0AAU9M463_9ASTR|nr:unnamed protein product [Lactuca virosa]